MVVSIQSEARRLRRNLTGIVCFVIFVAVKLNAGVSCQRDAEIGSNRASAANPKCSVYDLVHGKLPEPLNLVFQA